MLIPLHLDQFLKSRGRKDRGLFPRSSMIFRVYIRALYTRTLIDVGTRSEIHSNNKSVAVFLSTRKYIQLDYEIVEIDGIGKIGKISTAESRRSIVGWFCTTNCLIVVD